MKGGYILVDYIRAKECKNREAWFICYKCGKCGRKFDEFGYMVDDGGTTSEDGEDENGD